MPTTNGAALTGFVECKTEIDAAIDRIRASSDDHFVASPEDVHRGHVRPCHGACWPRCAAQTDHGGDILRRETGAVIAI